MLPLVHPSPQPKWYLDRFSRFRRTHSREPVSQGSRLWQTDRQTDRQTPKALFITFSSVEAKVHDKSGKLRANWLSICFVYSSDVVEFVTIALSNLDLNRVFVLAICGDEVLSVDYTVGDGDNCCTLWSWTSRPMTFRVSTNLAKSETQCYVRKTALI